MARGWPSENKRAFREIDEEPLESESEPTEWQGLAPLSGHTCRSNLLKPVNLRYNARKSLMKQLVANNKCTSLLESAKFSTLLRFDPV